MRNDIFPRSTLFTLDSFIARSSLTGLGNLDPVEMLVDKVIVDGDEIKVVFKAGVEILLVARCRGEEII